MDGIIICPTQKSRTNISMLRELGVPYLLISRHFDSFDDPFVGTDDLKGGYMATRHLIELGHRRIAFLSGLPLNSPAHHRYQNFLDALQAYGMETDPALLIGGDGVTDEQSGYEAADALLRSGVPFTGVFAVNDLMAIGAMKRFWQAGLRIPEDVSIVGCDGIQSTEYTTPPLSTLQCHAEAIGTTLIYQLLEKMQPDRVFPLPQMPLQAQFIQRQSMGPAREK